MRRIIINEIQFQSLFGTRNILTENRASKNQSLARKMVRSINPSLNDKEFTEKVLHDIPNVRKADFHLYPAVVRFILTSGNSLDANTIQNLNKYVGIIAPKSKELGLDQNANGMDLQDFFTQFQGDVSNSEKNDREASAQYGTNSNGNNNDYKIVPISTFDKANEYSYYTNWCVTQDKSAFNRYTDGRKGIFYFLLKRDFKNVPKEIGPNCPLDEYGLSMIAVSFREDGSVNTITCRWNHDYGGNDSIMTPEQVSKLIGTDIDSIFNPNDIQSLIPENIEVLNDKLKCGLKLCKNTKTNELCIYSDDFTDYACFNNKNYVVYNGRSNYGNDISALIDRKGHIYTVCFGRGRINVFENNGLLYVIHPEEGLNYSNIYDVKTLDVVKENAFSRIDYYRNSIIMADNEGHTLIVNKPTNKIMFDDYIDDFWLTTSKIFLLKNNQITSIDAIYFKIYLPWSDIKVVDKWHATYFLRNKHGLFIVSETAGLVNKTPIQKAYLFIPYDNSYNEQYYLLTYENGAVLLSSKKFYIIFISSKEMEEIPKEGKLTPIAINDILK